MAIFNRLLCMFGLLFACETAFAQPTVPMHGNEIGRINRLASQESVRVYEDINGDGFPEIAALERFFFPQAMQVVLYDGRRMQQLQASPLIPQPSSGALGSMLWVLDDLDADGRRDFAVGMSPFSGGAAEVKLLSSNFTQTQIFTPSSLVSAGLGQSWELVDLGDITGDGVGEVAVAGWSTGFSGAEIYSGSFTNLAPIFSVGGSSTSAVTLRVLSVRDLDNDSVRDIILHKSQGTSAVLEAYRGTSGTPLWNMSIAGAYPTSTHSYAENIGDIDGDGFDDIALPRGGSSALDVVSTATQQVIRSFSTATIQDGFRVFPLGFYDGDLERDYLLLGRSGLRAVYSGRTGMELSAIENFASLFTPSRGMLAVLPVQRTFGEEFVSIEAYGQAASGSSFLGFHGIAVESESSKLGGDCEVANGASLSSRIEDLPSWQNHRVGTASKFIVSGPATSQVLLMVSAADVSFVPTASQSPCNYFVKPSGFAIVTSTVLDAQGFGVLSVQIPNDPALIGQKLNYQAILADPLGNVALSGVLTGRLH